MLEFPTCRALTHSQIYEVFFPCHSSSGQTSVAGICNLIGLKDGQVVAFCLETGVWTELELVA